MKSEPETFSIDDLKKIKKNTGTVSETIKQETS